MKILTLILLVFFLVVSGYFLIFDFKISTETNFNIYLCLLIIVMLICIVGILINLPFIFSERKRYSPILHKSYSNKRIKNPSLDNKFKFLQKI